MTRTDTTVLKKVVLDYKIHKFSYNDLSIKYKVKKSAIRRIIKDADQDDSYLGKLETKR